MDKSEQYKADLEWGRARLGRVPDQDSGESVFGPPNPTADMLGQHYVDTAEPFVRGTRKEVFKTVDPPFEGDEAEAAAWLAKHQDHIARDLVGIAPPHADRVFVWATERLVEVTGFSRRAVESWLLTGAEPRLSPYEIRTPHNALKGTDLRTRRVQITIHVPLKRDEKRDIWDKLRGQWEQVDFEGGFIELPQRIHGLTEKNRAVKELWDRTPKPPWTWAKRAAEWNREQKESIGPEGLRVHWKRLEDKLKHLGIPYRADTDED